MASLQEYYFEWLAVSQFPLANKFYKAQAIRGKVGRCDRCAVLRHADKGIVAVAVLKTKVTYTLLSHVAVTEALRGQGLGSYLVSQMISAVDHDTYCFPFKHLEQLYERHGFCPTESSAVPDLVSKQYDIYRQQGRDLTLMRFRAPDDTLRHDASYESY